MSKNSKRPRMQKTVQSDIAPLAIHQFTHSSNSSTRTRQIVTTARMEPPDPMNSSSPLIEMDPPDEFPLSGEVNPPAGVEVLTKAQRYVNSV